MAVNMNERERLLKRSVVLLIVFSVAVDIVLSATTQPPVVGTTTAAAPPATTTAAAPTTTAPTTTTVPTTTTTTTPVPIQPPAAQLDPSILAGQCPCDVTGNACDVSCCCDEDCSAADLAAFPNRCLPFSQDEGDKLCFKEELFLSENSDEVISDTKDGFFCIYNENYLDRNYYNEPDLVVTLDTFHEYQAEFSSPSFQSPPLTTEVLNASFYKSGDPIYTVSDTQALGMLGLPRTLNSVDCIDDNPAAYLLDQKSSCVRSVSNLQSECTNTLGLDANHYFTGFRVITSPQLFQPFDILNITLNQTDEVFSLYTNNNYTVQVRLDNRTSVNPIQCRDIITGVVSPCPYTSLPSPSLQGTNECQDVVTEVSYSIVTDGTAGIVEVWASFVLTNLTSSPSTFTQSFSTVFQSVRETESVARSGNVGYTVGQPLLAGTLNKTTNSERIELNADRNQYMTVVRSSASGDCVTSAQDRASILFGQDIQSGCMLRLTASNLTEYCTRMQELILSALEFDSVPQVQGSVFLDNNRYVGFYGNSDPIETGDWVKILYLNRLLPSPPPPQTSSCQLSVGLSVHVMYTNIGALINPQPKVIAVTFAYDDPADIQVKPTSTGQYNQPVAISSSVTFHDISKQAVGFEPNPSIYQAKVPDDFFYPFATGGSGCFEGCGLRVWMLSTAVMCMVGGL